VKKEYIILAVVIAALVLYLAFRSTDRTHYELPDVQKPDRDAITSISITGPSGTVYIQRSDDGWVSEQEGYPIDQGKVDGMLDALSGIDLISLVSEAKSYTQYELDEAKRVSVEASDMKNPLLKLDIGKTASTHRHTYVKLPDDENVYQASGDIRRTFDVDLPALRDRKVMGIDRSAITGIKVETGGESLSLTKITRPSGEAAEGEAQAGEVTAWITADSLEADGTVVDGILGRVVNLQCDGFPAAGEQLDLGSPDYTLIIDHGRSDTLRVFGPYGEKKSLATSSQYKFPFVLAEWKLGQIKKTPDEIMGKADEEE
jgi:hypothetical protein